jgi:hypothetical protein
MSDSDSSDSDLVDLEPACKKGNTCRYKGTRGKCKKPCASEEYAYCFNHFQRIELTLSCNIKRHDENAAEAKDAYEEAVRMRDHYKQNYLKLAAGKEYNPHNLIFKTLKKAE